MLLCAKVYYCLPMLECYCVPKSTIAYPCWNATVCQSLLLSAHVGMLLCAKVYYCLPMLECYCLPKSTIACPCWNATVCVTNGISFHARVGRFSPFLYLRSVAIAVILFWLHFVVLVSPCFLGPRISRDYRFPRAPLFLCSERKPS